jgi:hypothetical protein
MFNYPANFGQCTKCIFMGGDSSVGIHEGCTNENVFDEDGNDISDFAYEWITGELGCPYRDNKEESDGESKGN